MALTEKLKIQTILRVIEKEIDEVTNVYNKLKTDTETSLLDIGCGMHGSSFVNVFHIKFPHVNIFYLDLMFLTLVAGNKTNMINGDARKMPFLDNSFDMVYAGHIVNEGIIKDLAKKKLTPVAELFSTDLESLLSRNPKLKLLHEATKLFDPYEIAKETYRVLKQDGLFIFTYDSENDAETSRNLFEMGFKEIRHITKRAKDVGVIDTYTAIK